MDGKVESGRWLRMARLASAAARSTAALATARVRQQLGGDEAETVRALRPTAERLVEVLGELKGAATKLGQFISVTEQGVLPDEARQVLTRLLHQAPGRIPPAQARAIIEAEIGGSVDAHFSHFDDEPLAAASLGQVHAATTRDGRDVVVKVQFPGVDEAMESDLRNLTMAAKALAIGGDLLDGREYADEIAATLRREIDYREEVRQLEAFREAVAPWPELVLPEPLTALSGRRVLTMTRLRGPTLLQVAQHDDTPAAQRLQVSVLLIQAIWGPFLRSGLVHADPHPGNYIVLDDGRLGILDFGATRALSPGFVAAYWRILDASLRDGRADIPLELEAAGFEFGGERDKVAVWLAALCDIIERPLRQASYDWGQCTMVRDVVALRHNHLMSMLRCKAPVESLMFYRAVAGAAGDLRMLKGAGNFREVMVELAATARQTMTPAIAASVA
jgi:predicted unusual protein kinase regulating ubiquinone biosynthesis (AarF/ABC1/UbiB family)